MSLCGQSVQACARTWEGMLGIQAGSIEGYVYLGGDSGMEVGLGCAMEALFASSDAKHHSDLTIYWAHIVGVFGLLKAREVAKFVVMEGRLKPRQERERRFPAVLLPLCM